MATAEAIRPDDILKQIAAHWLDLGDPGGDGDGLLRACSMTLTCFADDEEDSATLNEMLASLMREHPSRLIVVRLKDGEDELSARVSAQCWKPFGHQKQICCEYVEVTASINRLADAASIVAPLAAPDLPRVVLLRSARIVRAGALRKVLPLGDKIIVDSRRTGAPGFGELGGLLDAGHITGDLAWTRLTPIRALLAQLLEKRQTRTIAIEYGGREAGPEARYLQAWLQTALPEANVALRGNAGVDEGCLAAVRVDDDFSVHLCRGGAEYEVGALKQRASMPPGTEEQLLNEELGIVVHDRAFELALNHITA
ncbi:MAG TPA: glucose-6-phosphate dehydrogenase assembly protein OpcA [Bryobacteraceae bacterium]|nr:glucose-6-phosphate dehydrogenase assembly protein OpcA [Bryobacteraceae bacterium]